MSKTAWVLGGGGAKGSFEVGVMKQLAEKGITPDALYGTSVGALNVAGFSYGGIVALEKAWRGIKGRGDIISFQLKSVILQSRGIFSTKPLRHMIESLVKGDLPNGAPVPAVTITNIETGDVQYLTPYNCRALGMTFIDAVVASATLPFIMEPVHGVWVDGGIRETVPLAQAIHEGATDIYVLMCQPWTRNLDVKDKIHNWFNVILSMIDIITHEIFINDVQLCLDENDDPDKRVIAIHLYAPDHQYVDTLDFSSEKITLGIKTGYEAIEIAHEILRGI